MIFEPHAYQQHCIDQILREGDAVIGKWIPCSERLPERGRWRAVSGFLAPKKKGGDEMSRFEPHAYQSYCIEQIIQRPKLGLFLD